MYISEFAIPYKGKITKDVGIHIAAQIKDVLAYYITQNYRPNPPRFKGDMMEPEFELDKLRIVNTITTAVDRNGRELPDSLKIQYDGRLSNVCHIDLEQTGSSIKVRLEMFGWPLNTDIMHAVAEKIEKQQPTLDQILTLA